jgi:hypothetical protein
MTFTMGYAPQDFLVVLTPGADFVSALARPDEAAWDPGLRLTLDLGPDHQWDAELSGQTATWLVDSEDVDAALASNPSSARLWYVDGETRLLWAVGRVSVRR